MKHDYVTATLGGTEYKFRLCQIGRRLAKMAGHDPDAYADESLDEGTRAVALLYVSALPYHRDIAPEDFEWATLGEIMDAFKIVLAHATAGVQDSGKYLPELSELMM
jgi:hypothetical protein